MDEGRGLRYDSISSDELTPYERAQFREMLPQIKELLETRRLNRRVWQSVGMFLLAAPAVTAMWQGLLKLVEWMRHQ
jgi:hypothetical protein